ncbi:MAG: hypothetical protein GY811_06160 [Myxococcales bacterium]|nr:hypothetical protein [Myxococcales bacterium]
MAASDYDPYLDPWWGTFNWSPNMILGATGLSLTAPGEDRFSILPGETVNIINCEVWLEPIYQGSVPTAANTAFLKASAYLPQRRITTQTKENFTALPDCTTPPESGDYGS